MRLSEKEDAEHQQYDSAYRDQQKTKHNHRLPYIAKPKSKCRSWIVRTHVKLRDMPATLYLYRRQRSRLVQVSNIAQTGMRHLSMMPLQFKSSRVRRGRYLVDSTEVDGTPTTSRPWAAKFHSAAGAQYFSNSSILPSLILLTCPSSDLQGGAPPLDCPLEKII